MPEEKLPLELRLGLRTGSVFYFRARELFSEKPHFFVVVNANPLTDELLLMTVFTSQIDKVQQRNRERAETVVTFGPGDYAPLDRPTAVDGNVILRRSLGEMAELVRRKEMVYHPDLPPALLERIRAAILSSPVIEDEDKDLIRGGTADA
ncbi:MAG: hypothetical protein KDK97_22610 [Verrucomicrobiales bacterium]|nr:hypothetical protein [Verrucomicrobiales bacterium]MCP5556460.1 hypothetical protein [Verrucomicrobiaceae bacterium]